MSAKAVSAILSKCDSSCIQEMSVLAKKFVELLQGKLGSMPAITPFNDQAKTCADVERITGLKTHQIGKSMILGVDKRWLIAVLPGDKKVDFNLVKESCSAKKCFAMPVASISTLTGLTVGAITPLLALEKDDVEVIMDESLSSQTMINISAGDLSYGINIDPKVLAAIVKARILSFAK